MVIAQRRAGGNDLRHHGNTLLCLYRDTTILGQLLRWSHTNVAQAVTMQGK
jgi:hypothetical protein